MSKVYLKSGTAWKVGPRNTQKAVTEVDIPEYSDCCKLDCCTGGIFTFDIADPDTTMVMWFENGVREWGTVEEFETALAQYE